MTTEFLGNDKLMETLAAWTKSGRFPHAILADGPQGSGKSYFAKLAGKTILCTGDHAPCNQCSSCMKMDKEIHPDFHMLEGEGGARSFHVSQIRELREEAWTSPNDGDKKVFFLRHCEEMSHQAQNALLKIMEEPPKGVYFILTCENQNLMLSTIRSRGTLLTLNLPEKKESIAYLSAFFPEISQNLIENALASGNGSIGNAIKYLGDDEEETVSPQLSKDLWKELKKRNQLGAMAITGKFERDKEGLGKLLKNLKTIVMEELVEPKEKDRSSLSNLQLVTIVDIIEEIDYALSGNSNMLLLVTLLPAKIGEVVTNR